MQVAMIINLMLMVLTIISGQMVQTLHITLKKVTNINKVYHKLRNHNLNK